ncbi:MAG: hypothetical protein P4N59_22965 [Negativicutes bacterium]|nr:hypothetical protein [Negativicutes bacterium]
MGTLSADGRWKAFKKKITLAGIVSAIISGNIILRSSPSDVVPTSGIHMTRIIVLVAEKRAGAKHKNGVSPCPDTEKGKTPFAP